MEVADVDAPEDDEEPAAVGVVPESIIDCERCMAFTSPSIPPRVRVMPLLPPPPLPPPPPPPVGGFAPLTFEPEEAPGAVACSAKELAAAGEGGEVSFAHRYGVGVVAA